MINNSDRHILHTALPPEVLDQQIRDAISFTIRDESQRLGSTDREIILLDPSDRSKTFAAYFAEELRTDRTFNADFLETAFDFAQLEKLRVLRAPVAEAKGLLTTNALDRHNGTRLTPIRRGLRTMFLFLWSKNVLVLPLEFSVDTSITENARKLLLTEVAAFFWEFPTMKAEPKFEQCFERESKDASSLQHKGTKFIFTTNWHSFGDVDITSLSDRYSELIQSDYDPFVRTANVFVDMLCKLNSYYQDMVQFDCSEIAMFRSWTRSGEFRRFTLSEYRLKLPELRTERKQIYATRSNEKARKDILEKKFGKEVADQMEISVPTVESELMAIAKEPSFVSAPLEYFLKLPSQKRGFSTARYVGRDHIDVAELGKEWFPTFNGFVEHKRRKGNESLETLMSALSIFCDYLFMYLPWWREQNPEAAFVFPETPADFHRAVFVIGGSIEENTPIPFLEILSERREEGGQGQVITNLTAYFKYLSGFKSQYPALANRTIDEVFIKDLDHPGRKEPKSKTNKVPFPRQIMPYLYRYIYALEAFGMHLQQLSLQGEKHIELHRQPTKIAPADFAFESTFKFKEKDFVINEFENVWPIAKQSIRMKDGSVKTAHIPVLGAVRMVLAALETGLRFQSVQWLDIEKWDSLIVGPPQIDGTCFPLFVNTDKTKNGAWATYISLRVYELLGRERSFQLSLAEPNTNLINYENRVKSRFPPINPLFRSARKEGKPIADAAYNAVWTRILVGFERFYNSQVSPNDQISLFELGPKFLGGCNERGSEIVEKVSDVEYSPLKLKPIHTPHSARSSFISHRASILGVDVLAQFVGHTNTRVTSHYIIEDQKEIAEKLMRADSQSWDYDPSDTVAIRADAENSALRRSLRKDREAASASFGFVTLQLLNNEDENFKDAVELLKTTPASQLVYRETHICPVGEACPTDVLRTIYEPRRCGLCPIALKCVDHLPAIAAKIHQLKDQILTSDEIRAKRESQGETAIVNEIDERRKLDSIELAGWITANSTLASTLEQLKLDRSKGNMVYHVDMPDAVRLHLTHVTRPSSKADFLLQCLIDSKNYPGMETSAIRSKATVLRMRLLADAGLVNEALASIPEGDEVQAVLSTLRVVAASLGITGIEVLARTLIKSGEKAALGEGRPVLTDGCTPTSPESTLIN